jgi:endonuclease YncB( thermonuclease family)
MNRSIVVFFALLLLFTVVASCLNTPDDGVSGVVTWVVDGDTFYVDDQVIRLFSVDAPELDTPLGEAVKWELIDLIYGEIVVVSCDGFDVYDRMLCDVSHRGVDIGNWLLENGYAREWK